MPIDPITAAQVTADHYGLPTGRIESRDTTAHVFLNSLHGLAEWHAATGGYTTCWPAGSGVVLWTLHTHTDNHGDGTHTPIYVHAPALADQLVPHELTDAAA